jgi:RNA polymerase sigma factor (TIGR02999 family)
MLLFEYCQRDRPEVSGVSRLLWRPGRRGRLDCPCRPYTYSREWRKNGTKFFADSDPMSSESVEPVTELLQAAQAGDADAAERLLAIVYDQLHKLARARMANLQPGQTLQPTALVHEAYLRLTDKTGVAWESRRHFFFAAARAMRDILVEQARRKAGPVRGGGRRRQELDEACAVIEPPSEDVLAVHEALEELDKQDPLKAQIVLLRYFSGLTTDETADILGLAASTLDRKWRYIRAWLLKRLG